MSRAITRARRHARAIVNNPELFSQSLVALAERFLKQKEAA
ncbi:MAG: hypothetical protein QGF09_04715 [Rhodospirillales bacterium]|jgi:hypothetical protein|nr:hypothetical protein [Rhodospirillales bacterium]